MHNTKKVFEQTEKKNYFMKLYYKGIKSFSLSLSLSLSIYIYIYIYIYKVYMYQIIPLHSCDYYKVSIIITVAADEDNSRNEI